MTKNDDQKKLTRLQRAAVDAILETKTAKEAASRAGCSESSIYKYLQDPAFNIEVRQREKQIRDAVGYRLASGANVMLDVIEQVAKGEIKDEPGKRASVRLRAAMAWLDNHHRTQDQADTERRLSDLEARASHE